MRRLCRADLADGWAFGTWLIPPLVAAGFWRHVYHRIPLSYEAPLWSVVFPLGMYAVGGYYLGEADHLLIVRDIGSVESWVALAVWTVTFIAMLRHLVATVVLGSRETQKPLSTRRFRGFCDL